MKRIGMIATSVALCAWGLSSAFAAEPLGDEQPRPETVATLPTSHDDRPVINAAPGTPPIEITVPTPEIVLPVEAPKVDAPKVESAQAKPALRLASEISDRLKREKVSGGDREDRDAAVALYDKREGEPIWVDEKGLTKDAAAVVADIRSADDWGLQASAFKLPDLKIRTEPSRAELADAEVTLSLAALKYARHARGGRTDPQQLSKYLDRKPQLYAPASILAELARAAHPSKYLLSLHPSNPQFELLRQKYLAARAGRSVAEVPPPSTVVAEEPGKTKKKAAAVHSSPSVSTTEMQMKILVNMEMWRWMPEMGATFIQNNVPEFTTRLVRGGKTVHLERIVVGKPDTQTPIFSDTMSLVVFQPFWNVPESIKWKELQPGLARTNGESLHRAGLRVAYNGRELDPSTVDWATADMRAMHVYQPPGAGNALGQVKFRFPNKHDVYMHDTPSKSLFNQPVRAFSHGCMRVRDPLKFAEMLLGEDKGWPMSRIVQLANTGPQDNEIKLSKSVPIHITYFTTWVDEDGKLKTFNDIYGHEKRIQLGLEGKAHQIAQAREEKYVPPQRAQGPQGGVRMVQKQPTVENWIKNIFNF